MNRKIIRDYVLIMVGTFMLAYAIEAFWAPHNLVTGGVSGLAIIINDYFGIPNSFSVAALNAPLFLIGYKAIPRVNLARTVFGALFLPFALFLLEQFSFVPMPPSDLVLAGVFGGAIAGVGVGLVLRASATTGGSTLAAEILHRTIFKQYSVPKILFVVDSAIVLFGLAAFGAEAAMYAVIAIFVSTKVTDAVLEGLSFSKAAFIISKESDAIADAILNDMNRGCTAIDSRGMFTKQSQSMLLCVVSAKEIVTLKELVYSRDERAFVIVASVHEVLGEGFTEKI